MDVNDRILRLSIIEQAKTMPDMARALGIKIIDNQKTTQKEKSTLEREIFQSFNR